MATASETIDRRTVTALIALWFLLVVFTVLYAVPRIEDQLAATATEALAETSVDVRVSGRDATLTAAASSGDVATAQATVRAIDGIRSVRVITFGSAPEDITVNPDTEERPVEPVLDDPSLKVTADRDSFTLTGSVATDETAQALTAAGIAAYGQERITFDIDVDPDTLQPRWLDDPFNLLAIVGRHDLGIEIYDRLFRLTGTVPDEATHADVLASLETELDGRLEIVDRIVIVPLVEPTFSMTSVGGSVTLRGTLPSQGEVDSIRAAAEAIYGNRSVATWLAVDSTAPAVPYLTDAEAFFRAFEGRTLEFVELEGVITLSGAVPTEEVRTSIGDALNAILDPVELVNALEVVEVSPETAAAIDEINSIIGASLNFAPNSSDLSDDDKAKLDEVAAILADNPTLRAVVEGHTDDLGSEPGNQRLSEARAIAVVDYLVSVGIDPDRLSTIGFGESRPIASNSTSSGRAQNRRIEFNVEGSS